MRRMKPASSRASLWTRHSRFLLGGFLLTVVLIIYVWWPLAEAALAYTDWSAGALAAFVDRDAAANIWTNTIAPRRKPPH